MLTNTLKKPSAESGFTLIELMVVVAIIGILAAVAIPNFQKYQARARQSEAKLALASVYAAEASFYADNNTYTGCLASAGFQRSTGAANLFYTTGFTSATAVGAFCSPTAATACNTSRYDSTGAAAGTCVVNNSLPANIANADNYGFAGATLAIANTAIAALNTVPNAVLAVQTEATGMVPAQVGSTVGAGAAAAAAAANPANLSQNLYVARAVGVVSSNGAVGYDRWAMDNTKNIANASGGI